MKHKYKIGDVFAWTFNKMDKNPTTAIIVSMENDVSLSIVLNIIKNGVILKEKELYRSSSFLEKELKANICTYLYNLPLNKEMGKVLYL